MHAPPQPSVDRSRAAPVSSPAAAIASPRPAGSVPANDLWTRVSLGIQRAAQLSAPGDLFEQEADSVAERVMRMADPAVALAAPITMQRKCACGGQGDDCGCGHGNDDASVIRPQRVSVAAPAPSAEQMSAAAGRARAGGTPLPDAVRSYFEPRFGRDFGGVRIHTDGGAHAAARGIQARAYTLGQDVVFASGEYAPGSDVGRRLLAHELTHVVQQAGDQTGDVPALARAPGLVQRDVAKPSVLDSAAQAIVAAAADSKRDAGVRGTLLVWSILKTYYPNESKALWVNDVSFAAAMTGLDVKQKGTGAASQAAIVVGDDFRDHATEPLFERRVADVGHVVEQVAQWRTGTGSPAVCSPDRPLTWADYTGSGTAYDAYTAFDHALATVGGEQVITATFAPSRSYVKTAAKAPLDRTTSGCGTVIGLCERALAGKKDVTLPLAASGGCAAGVQPDPSVVATSSKECKTVLGPECDRVRVLESARLLRHEQLHFDIACVLARKGTRALSFKPAESARILQAVKDRTSELSADGAAYDSETAHSCNAGPQAAWESTVAMGMPLVVIT